MEDTHEPVFKGLQKAYEEMIKTKRLHKRKVAIMRKGKVLLVDPEELPITNDASNSSRRG